MGSRCVFLRKTNINAQRRNLTMQKMNQSKKWMFAAAVVMFLIMLVCNLLTDMFTDDFHYMHSFVDWETRITSVAQIFPSMYHHAFDMNGRLVAHFLVQLFLLLPGIVFDVVNSLVFLLQVYLIYRLANHRRERSLMLFCVAFAGVWLFELAFGQVNFWLTGSCNYLWCAVVCLLFLLPYADKLFHNRDLRGAWKIALYLILSFVAGGYSENASPAVIFTAFFLACYAKFVMGYRLKLYHYAALAVAFLGFLCLALVPASSSKMEEFSPWKVVVAVGRSGNMFYKMWPVVMGFTVLFIVGCFKKLPKEILAGAFILAAGAVFAECIMIIGDYNVERRAFFTLVLLLTACCLLMRELVFLRECKIALVCLSACMMLASFYYISLGLCDIGITHRDVLKNRAYIAKCKAAGQMEIVLPEVKTRTRYNALEGLQYLRTNPSYWLNKCMARYYGVDKITMEPAEEE